jgi:hypothetical protein
MEHVDPRLWLFAIVLGAFGSDSCERRSGLGGECYYVCLCSSTDAGCGFNQVCQADSDCSAGQSCCEFPGCSFPSGAGRCTTACSPIDAGTCPAGSTCVMVACD